MSKNVTVGIYKPDSIEVKWQKVWRQKKLFKASNTESKKKYVLVEFPYPSGDLHMGHWYAFAPADVYARFSRMQGYEVLFPIGFDAFGLPAENAAIKRGVHPRDWTYGNIKTMTKQFETMGPSFDWDRQVISSDIEYYRWTQWMFLQMYKAGLAYRAEIPANWCPECQTVLANEQVENGRCWRHSDTEVVQRNIEQWLFKLTAYADKLLWPEDPKKRKVDWPDSVVDGQNNWIGRKEGINIRYKVVDSDEEIICWTSRPDTNFGATFVVLAPEHPFTLKISTQEHKQKVKEYIKRSQKRTELERVSEGRNKTGIFTGRYVVNQLTDEKLPVWVSDFVLAGVGSGAVVGVPGHDKRDFEFAKKFKLPVKRVVVGSDGDKSPITNIAQVEEEETEGVMVNSGFLNGLDIHQATKKVMDYLEKKGWGKRVVSYHIHDWTISRQRYWGAPIPMIHCPKCARLDPSGQGIVPVPEKDLPVKLPYKVDYTPRGKAPLATAPDFVNVKCPKCGGDARRDTDTMDTFVDSSWYFFRYASPHYKKAFADPKLVKHWLPVDLYFGGSEHTLGHTMYARFITRVLHDLGYVPFDEFALKRVHHGIIMGPDGYRMSKSRGNVVNPDAEVKKYGADTVRLYLCFMSPHDQGGPWDPSGIMGVHRFLQRVWDLVVNDRNIVLIEAQDSRDVLAAQHKTVKKITEDLVSLKFNTAIASMMEYLNLLRKMPQGKVKRVGTSKVRCAEWDEALRTLVLLLAPFAPHITEELWQNVLHQKGSVHVAAWPTFATEFATEQITEIPVQVNGKLRGTVQVEHDEAGKQDRVEKEARAVDGVNRYLEGKKIQKVIFVLGRLINFVTS